MLGVVLLCLAGTTQAEVLIPAGSSWKHLDTGADLGTGWTAPSYDDSLWPSNPAKLGYGDPAFDDAAWRASLAPFFNDEDSMVFRSTTVSASARDPVDAPPMVAAVAPPPGPLFDLGGITVGFTKPVTGVDAADLQVAGVAATNVTAVGDTWTFTFARPPEGSVQVTRAAGHAIRDLDSPAQPFDAAGPGATWSYATIDNVAPRVAALDPPAGAWVRALTNITVWFDEPVAGVDAHDLLVGGRPASSVAGGGAGPYAFHCDPPGTGWVTVEWAPSNGVHDLAPAPNDLAPGHWLNRITRLAMRHVIHISIDGLGAYYLKDYMNLAPTGFPSFVRLRNEGVSTLNARGDAGALETMPNHTTMLTGRPMTQPAGWENTRHHGITFNFDNGGTIHSSGNPNVAYQASVFDVVHDHGKSTGFLYTKTKFAFYVRSWNPYGAPDTTGEDNGTAKIDFVADRSGNSAGLTDSLVARIATNGLWAYTFVHYADPDTAGHASGWGSAAYSNTVAQIDTQIGSILDALQANPLVGNSTAVILSADHGGHDFTHGDLADPRDFTLPFFVWGAGIPPGVDAVAFFSNRGDPGAAATDYNTAPQPVRNGDGGNLALALLGLPPVPGSSILPAVAALQDNVPAPVLGAVTFDGDALRLRFDGVPGHTYRILWCDDLRAGQWWTLDGATADGAGAVSHMSQPPPDVPQRFYRAVYP